MKPLRPKPLDRWHAPLLVVAVGIAVLGASVPLSHRTLHRLPALSAQEKAIVHVPLAIRNWRDFYAAYRPPSCLAWRQTLRAYAEAHPALDFPANGEVEMYFDESSANRERALPVDVRARVDSILGDTDDRCSKLGE